MGSDSESRLRRRRRWREFRVLLIAGALASVAGVAGEVLFVIPVAKTGTFVLPFCLNTQFPGSDDSCSAACFGIVFPGSGGPLSFAWKVNGTGPATVDVRLIQNDAEAGRCPTPGPVAYQSTSMSGFTTITVPPSAPGQPYPPLEVDAHSAYVVTVQFAAVGTYALDQPLFPS